MVAFFRGSQAIPVAMTRFGQEELAEFDPLYVPHGINTEAYRPSDGAEMREQMDIPADAFIVGMVAANKGRPSRKGFQQAFEAFRFFRERHENAYLYLHTMLSPDYASGEDLPALLDSLEIPEDVVRFPNQYSMVFSPLNSGQMASIYSAMDVLLNPSLGEGFGIPILEAQACGVPVIVTEFTAMTEVCGAGWKVKGRPYWTAQKSWQSIADVGHLVDALEECHDLSDEARKALSRGGNRPRRGLRRTARVRGAHAPGLRRDRGTDRRPSPGRACSMRVGWIADDPGYVGGAELTQAEFRAAAPEGVEVVDCPC